MLSTLLFFEAAYQKLKEKYIKRKKLKENIFAKKVTDLGAICEEYRQLLLKSIQSDKTCTKTWKVQIDLWVMKFEAMSTEWFKML